MNRILKQLFACVFNMMIASCLYAQPVINYDVNLHQFKITIPGIKKPKDQVELPFTRVFFETGDGQFKVFTGSGKGANSFILPWHFADPTAITPVANAVAFYDTIKPRPRPMASAKYDPAPTSGGANEITSQLEGSERIKIVSAADVLLPGDSLPIAVVVKTNSSSQSSPAAEQAVVALFSNGGDNPGIFHSLAGNPLAAYNPVFNMVRFSKEWANMRLEDLPDAIKSKINDMKSNGGFNDVFILTRKVDPNDSINEENIFFTMAANSNTEMYKSEYTATLNAALVLTQNDQVVNEFESPFVFKLSLFSRDPNGIRTIPHCLGRLSGQNRKLSYELQFENEGDATANTIRIDVKIPQGLSFPGASLGDATCYVGVDPLQLHYRALPPRATKKDRVGYYSYLPEERIIRFVINNAGLKGRIAQNGNAASGSGRIIFSLPVPQRLGNEDCLLSTMDIFFDNNPAVRDGFFTRGKCNTKIPCPVQFVDDGRKTQ